MAKNRKIASTKTVKTKGAEKRTTSEVEVVEEKKGMGWEGGVAVFTCPWSPGGDPVRRLRPRPQVRRGDVLQVVEARAPAREIIGRPRCSRGRPSSFPADLFRSRPTRVRCFGSPNYGPDA